MELDRRGAELLFQVLSEREETASVAIAINESFTGWTKTFTCPRLCAAIVDRLTFAGSIIETGTGSYRLAHALATRNGTEPSPDTERRRQMSPTRPPHGQPVTLVAAPRAALTTELPQLCERFFTTAGPTVIAELHTFLVAEGVHAATALGWFTDSLAFATYHPEPGK
jgi:hypothetical protein